MKKLFLVLAIVFASANAQAVETNNNVKYNFDAAHTNVIWFANHFGYSHPFGYFKDIQGYFTVDQQQPQNSTINVTIKIDSLTTPVDHLTEHLKGKDFFDAEKYPEAKFVSTKVDVTGKDSAKVTGDFTLHGVTKPLVLDVKLNGIGTHPFTQKPAAGFSATTLIKRSDFGMTSFLPGVGDDVRVVIETEGVKADDASALNAPKK